MSAAGGSVGPDLVDGDEQVGVGRVATAALEVLELGALPRQVVDHHVQEDVVGLSDVLDVVPRSEPWVDLAVGERGEAAVGR